MKKIVLYSLSALFSLPLFSQVTRKAKLSPPAQRVINDVNLQNTGFYTQNQRGVGVQTERTRAGLAFTTIGSSGNLFTALDGGCNQVCWSPGINSLTFAHRQNMGPSGSNSNQIDYSTDGGATWTTNILMTPDYDAGDYSGILAGNRYPSGAIYNPPANTDPANAFEILAGATHDATSGSGSWGYVYQGSGAFDGSNISEVYYQTPGMPYEYIPHGLQVASTGVSYFISPTFNNTGDASFDTINFQNYRLWGGIWNAGTNSVDWLNYVVRPDWHRYMDAGNTENYGGFDWNIAFGPDGMTGYAVTVGGLESDALYYPHPVVYKTTDGGLNWSLLPNFDFSTLTDVQNWIFPTGAGDVLPYTTNLDCTVDADNRLHIFSETLSKYTSDNTDDSLYYITVLLDPTSGETEYYTVMMHYSVSDGTDWDATMIDTITQNYGAYPTSTNINFIPQMSRTEDGNKIFFGWTKSNALLTTANDIPDLYMEGYDINSGLYTPPTNITHSTSYEGICYFPTLAPVCISGGASHDYEIPVVFAQPGATDADPANFVYIGGAGFDDEDFGAEPSAVADFTYAVAGTAVSFTNASMNADTYSWDFGDGTATSPLENPVHVYSMAGSYNVCLTASNASSDDTNCKTVNINTAIDDVQLTNALQVFPLPASDLLHVVINSDKYHDAVLELYNMNGQKVSSAAMDLTGSNATVLPLGDLAAGNYILKVTADNGYTSRQITISK